ncbi:hypothetical protein V8F63_08350 [Brevundimonas sp. LF-1]|uniref:hypothetical protein n=1 Tax=Brevundimonas sp. LF-1 TaxID=3126100 RepID=UPI0030E1F891
MTLALIDPASPAEEPACRSASARRPSKLLQREGAHDVVVPIPDGFERDFGGTLTQKRVVGRLHGKPGPLIVVAGGISADRYVHRTETKGLGWWSAPWACARRST